MSKKIFVTSDTHFFHGSMVYKPLREFFRNQSLEYMNDFLLAAINDTVGVDDELWHLGDFCWVPKYAEEVRSKILCKNVHLVFGNHDKVSKLRNSTLFASYQDLKYLNVDGERFVLCHYPFASWLPRSYHVHGHSHGATPPVPGRMDVGVDCIPGFRPILLKEVAAKLQETMPMDRDLGRNDERYVPSPEQLSTWDAWTRNAGAWW